MWVAMRCGTLCDVVMMMHDAVRLRCGSPGCILLLSCSVVVEFVVLYVLVLSHDIS